MARAVNSHFASGVPGAFTQRRADTVEQFVSGRLLNQPEDPACENASTKTPAVILTKAAIFPIR
jgi:hypothetical protein